MSKPRILLIDADVLAYEAAMSNEKAVEFEPGYWTWLVEFAEVVKTFDSMLAEIMDTLKGDSVKLCLTDSDGNFRKTVLPTYKGNRAKVKKPLALKAIRQYLIDECNAYLKPGLEGDDCMGILATWPGLVGTKIIVSIDKDMKTIPALVCRWPMERKPTLVTEAEADYWHLFQTLTGDTTDGYAGCPGMGKVGATKLLDADPTWAAVSAAFTKAKLTEDDALVQARVARILRAGDFDFQKKEPILWTP